MVKTPTLAAILVAILLPFSTMACIQISGEASAPLPSSFSVTMSDNGVEVCSGSTSGTGNGGSADCAEGYVLEWGNPVVNGDQHIHYCHLGGFWYVKPERNDSVFRRWLICLVACLSFDVDIPED